MAEEDIKFRFVAEGTDQAADGVKELNDELKKNEDATKDADKAHKEWVRNVRENAQHISNAVGLLGRLARAFGSERGGLEAELIGSVAQGVAFGAAFGPGGAVLGGITATVSGLGNLTREAQRVTDAMNAMTVDTVGAMREISHAIGDADPDAWTGAMARAQDQITVLEERARELRETASSTLTGILSPMDVLAARHELGRVEDQITSLRNSISELSEEASRNPVAASEGGGAGLGTFLNLDRGIVRTENIENTRTRRSGSRDRPTDFFAEIDNESADDAMARINEELSANEDSYRAYTEAVIQAEEEKNDYLRDLSEERMEEEREKQDYLLELETDRLDAQHEYEAEMAERRREAEEEEAERREQEIGSLLGFVQQGGKALTTALSAIATGTKSSDEAFKGLLASFLEMISEYAALKAATEFADAASSFARYDFGGGAAHIGAGLAFTAVAVATGVGAAVLNAPPAPPARPEANRDTATQGGSVTNVINWNSPVVTAGTRAELGREIEGLMSEAEAA